MRSVANVPAPRMINLGCGTRPIARPDALNVDWSPLLRLRASRWWWLARHGLSEERRQRLDGSFGQVAVHDLRKGIPVEDGSVEFVYHSHVLEHLEASDVPGFLAEIRRVLRPGGVHRIVVPDLEAIASAYLSSLAAWRGGASVDRAGLTQQPASGRSDHLALEVDGLVSEMIEQCVRSEPASLRGKRGWASRAERLLFGDARRRGEAHRWMYDELSLSRALESAGFDGIAVVSCGVSRFAEFAGFGVEQEADGSEYKERSLYVECTR